MPVEIEELDVETSSQDEIQVKLICEGCGEIIDEFEAFADQESELKGMRPIHDSLTCRRRALEKEGENL